MLEPLKFYCILMGVNMHFYHVDKLLLAATLAVALITEQRKERKKQHLEKHYGIVNVFIHVSTCVYKFFDNRYAYKASQIYHFLLNARPFL